MEKVLIIGISVLDNRNGKLTQDRKKQTNDYQDITRAIRSCGRLGLVWPRMCLVLWGLFLESQTAIRLF